MPRPKPARPTLRPTSPDVADTLAALDKPAVVSTPPRAAEEPAYRGALGSLAATGRNRFVKVPAPTSEPIRVTANLSVSIASAMRDRIDALAYEQKLGKTAIVEGALSALFENRTNEQIAKLLRDNGQGFRRRS